MRNYIALLIALVFTGGNFYAQEAISGRIADWDMGKGEVIGGLRTPVVLGSVEADGSFTIPLKADYLSEVRKQIAEDNKASTADWTSSLITLDRAFGCSSGGVEFLDADQPVSAVSTMGLFALGNMEEQRLYGYLIAASSDAFAGSIQNIMNYEFKPGFFVDWYYVEKGATIKGSCSMESYAINQEQTYTSTQEYDLEFQPGWNMVKYEIETVFEDRDGKSYPLKERYTTLKEVPAEMKFVFMPDDREGRN
jgi:hypothetical protein